MHGAFDDYRARIGKQVTDIDCFIGLILERLSRGGVEVVKRAQERNERYDALVEHVARTVRRSRIFQNPKRTADSEAVVIKSIIDFEKSKNKDEHWTYASGGLRQTMNDFLLVREYLDIYDGDHLRRLCDNWGLHFLSLDEREELKGVEDEKLRTNSMYERVKPRLRPLWLFFVALCYSLQDEDHTLSATDTFWLGLVDEVIGGSPDLFPFRLLIEDMPDPDAEAAPGKVSTDS
jgi:hypothetical protein